MRRLLVVTMLAVAGLWVAQAAGPAPNSLSSKEQSEGWTLLFDGKTLDGWTHNGAAEWKVENGIIKTDSPKGGGLFSKEDYSNFMLHVEFRGTPDINSGIYLRMARQGNIHDVGYEVQIRDIDKEGYFTGSLVGMAKTTAPAKIIPGQWNSFDITAQGDHFVIVYNGTKVLDTHDSKHASGAIGLQWAHPEQAPGKSIEFRNVKIRKLS